MSRKERVAYVAWAIMLLLPVLILGWLFLQSLSIGLRPVPEGIECHYRPMALESDCDVDALMFDPRLSDEMRSVYKGVFLSYIVLPIMALAILGLAGGLLRSAITGEKPTSE